MGQCKSSEQEQQIFTGAGDEKPQPDPNQLARDQEQAKIFDQKQDQCDTTQAQDAAAMAIQKALRGKMGKKQAYQERLLAEEDKPKDGVPYNGEFKPPQLPDKYYDKVDKTKNNENRLLPAFKLHNGSVYSGQWLKGKQSGYGMQKSIDGTFFDGQWKDGLMQEGIIRYPDGSIFSGTLDGGVIEFANGMIYEGQFLNRLPHGFGKEIHPDKSTYDGQFQNGQKHGKGVFKWPDHSEYQGLYEQGEISGHGTFKWPDGKCYIGQWQKSTMHGEGQMTYPDKRVYKGQFRNDKKEGHGKMIFPDGSYYEGEFSEDKRHGKGKVIRADKSEILCEWKNGQLVG